MPESKTPTKIQIGKYILLSVGILLVIISILYASAFLAIFGIALLFWDTLFLYLTPAKHVPLTYLEALSNGYPENVEHILSELNLSEKGIYLPPKNLNNLDSSLIFIPKKPILSLPPPEEISQRTITKNKNGVFLTPPGLGLVQLFEKDFGISFTRTDLENLQNLLPIVMVDHLELAEKVEIHQENKKITIKITGGIFDGICQQSYSLPHVHDQIGCVLASALACVLAKAIGKPITIQKEITQKETKTMLIEFLVIDY